MAAVPAAALVWPAVSSVARHTAVHVTQAVALRGAAGLHRLRDRPRRPSLVRDRWAPSPPALSPARWHGAMHPALRGGLAHRGRLPQRACARHVRAPIWTAWPSPATAGSHALPQRFPGAGGATSGTERLSGARDEHRLVPAVLGEDAGPERKADRPALSARRGSSVSARCAEAARARAIREHRGSSWGRSGRSSRSCDPAGATPRRQRSACRAVLR